MEVNAQYIIDYLVYQNRLLVAEIATLRAFLGFGQNDGSNGDRQAENEPPQDK